MPATATQGVVPAETLVVGNTLRGRQLTFTVNTQPAAIATARFAVRDAGGIRLFTTPCAVAGNVVTRPAVSGAVTAGWPVGVLTWDLELGLANGEERTWVRGTFVMLRTDQ